MTVPPIVGSRTDRPPLSGGTSPSCTAIGGCMTVTGMDGCCLYCSAPVTRVARLRLAEQIARLSS